MRSPLSTFSSEARRTLACLALTAAFLVAAEWGLRVYRGDSTLAYGYGDQGYHALVPELSAFGARPVSVVGSSRAREGILAPLFAKALRDRGHATEVGNYALSGARAGAVNQVVRHLLRASPPPRLIVYGITPLQLVEREEDPDLNEALIWTLPDLGDAMLRGAPDWSSHWQSAVRNTLDRYSLWSRLRPYVRDAFLKPPEAGITSTLDTVLQPVDSSRNPMRGELPEFKQGDSKNLHVGVGKTRILKYLEDQPLGGNWPNTGQVTRMRESIELCRHAGVPIVLAELPAHPMLRQFSEAQTYEGFYEVMSVLAAEFDVPFLTAEDIDAGVARRDHREQSHLNYRGARKYSQALARALPQTSLKKLLE